MVSYDTPMEVVEQLRIKIVDYVASNSREWSGCGLNIDKMEYQNAIHLSIGMEREYSFCILQLTICMLTPYTRSTKLAGLGRQMD
jgi:hypothetical protein